MPRFSGPVTDPYGWSGFPRVCAAGSVRLLRCRRLRAIPACARERCRGGASNGDEVVSTRAGECFSVDKSWCSTRVDPRICGELWRRKLQSGLAWNTSTYAENRHCWAGLDGRTPAYAGKTLSTPMIAGGTAKNPRICGECPINDDLMNGWLREPPHMQGRHRPQDAGRATDGKTASCARFVAVN